MDAPSPGMPASIALAVHRPVLSHDEPAVVGFERATFMTRECLHSPGPVNVVLEDDQPSQVIRTAVSGQWGHYLGRKPLHVRPSLLTSAQTMYHGVNVDENGQKTHHFTSLNASRILYNPTDAPEGGAFWPLELPYPRDDRIETSMSPIAPRPIASTAVILKDDGGSSPILIPSVFNDSIPANDLGHEANERDAKHNDTVHGDETPTTTELALGRDGSPLTTLSSGSEEYELVGSHAPDDDEDVCSDCGRMGHSNMACNDPRDTLAREHTPSSGPVWLELFSRNASPELPEFQGIVAPGFPENVVRMGPEKSIVCALMKAIFMELVEAKYGQDDDARAEMSAQLLAEDMDHGAKVLRAYLMHRVDGPEDVSAEINALTAANVSLQRLLSAFSVTTFPHATSHSSFFRPQDSSPLRADFGPPSEEDELVSLPDVVVLGDDELVVGSQSDPALSYNFPIHQQRATVDTEQASQTSDNSTSSSLPDLVSVSSTGSSSSWGSAELTQSSAVAHSMGKA
ncbi:hypothetical protein C8F01DRAFT_1303060 [Mycena amicta]|nr:hypothetical protein C8F01DRAFT_1303060 [Mycena amicta]